ncbi:hypothetical protein LINPERHAP1_LOCUS13006 [Linum perenne]
MIVNWASTRTLPSRQSKVDYFFNTFDLSAAPDLSPIHLKLEWFKHKMGRAFSK